MFHFFFNGRDQNLQQSIHSSPLQDYQQVSMQQVHGNQVAVIQEAPDLAQYQVAQVDAVLTQLPDVALIVRAADCLPILIYHPVGIIGAVHAGRRGTQSKILPATVKKMQQTWGLTTGFEFIFGPRICVHCYQISREPDRHFDLSAANKKQLKSYLPLHSYKLHDLQQCTVCQNDQFYSYRKEGPGVKMNYGVIGLID